VGRVDADLMLNDPDVSRRHATIEQSAGRVIVRDLKSTNGTFVNGVRVEFEVLKDGDKIRVGSTELQLEVTAEGERQKHVALFLDLGSTAPPQDVRHGLDALSHWAAEDLAELKPEVVMSPSTGRGMIIWLWSSGSSADERRRTLSKLIMLPSALRLEIGTVPPPSGAALRPMVG